MLPGIERPKSFARPALLVAFACACLAGSAEAQQPPIDRPPAERRPPIIRPPATIRREVVVGPPPESTMKKPDTIGLPASREPRSYDAGRDATYLNVPVTLIAHRAVKEPKGATFRFEGRELTLTFHLAYRGKETYDLVSAYLLVESTAAKEEAERLGAVRQLEINADPYEYTYERLDYQTEPVVPARAVAQQLRKETAAFRLPTEDLPQLAGAGRLVVKLGAETFTVKSPQLSELRRTLAAGARE
ncbi:MAG TPA: hypothetical protein VK421_06690 [Pyrinomonadaceae bacterium]|nr:hypothetical protein [Pyrinomonadaceae bacterium]